MVWREGGEMPTIVHRTFNAAFGACMNLARKNLGEKFHLLETRRIIVVVPETEGNAE